MKSGIAAARSLGAGVCTVRTMLRAAGYLAFFWIFSGCSGSSQGESATAGATPSGSTGKDIQESLRGFVADGPVTQSEIVARTAGGETVWTGTGSAEAEYSANFTIAAADYPMVLLARGGLDLVTGVAPEMDMYSAVSSTNNGIANINPFSTLIYELASARNGGLNDSAIQSATEVVTEQLNFGLDTTRLSDPVSTPVQNSNVATLVRSSEAIAEMIARTRAVLIAANVPISTDEIVGRLGADLTDGFVDGLGNGADGRLAATANIVSAQVLIETMTNELVVGGYGAADRMDAAISMIRPGTTIFTGDLRVPQEMIMQAGIAATAAFALSPSDELIGLLDALFAMPADVPISTAKQILPANAATMFDLHIAMVAAGPIDNVELVNDSIRNSIGPESVDQTPPVISLIGPPVISLFIDEPYVEPGATGTDNRDGDITALIVIDDSTIDTRAAGSYAAFYNLTDSAGNAANEVVRIVNVTSPDIPDNVAPIITLVGDNPLSVIQGDSYIDPGATASDDVDGDITSRIVIDSSSVVTATPDDYFVSYNVSDLSGNAANEAIRTVTVEPDPALNRPWEGILDEAVGFGGNVTGGLGKPLITVTNLNDSGAGSLRQALADNPDGSWIRFSSGLAGTISLSASLTPPNNTTIDGRGADITIGNSPTDSFHISAAGSANFAFLYLKITGNAVDGMHFGSYSGVSTAIDVSGIWLHHITFFGGVGDEYIDLSPRCQDVTLSYIYMRDNSRGILIDRIDQPYTLARYAGVPPLRLTSHHNWFDNITQRAPLARHSMVHSYNNLHENWNSSAVMSRSGDPAVTGIGVIFENSIGDASGAADVTVARFQDVENVEAAAIALKSVGTHLLKNGAMVSERDPASVFDPGAFYEYQADIANAALEADIRANAGWQNTVFPE